MKKKKRLPKVYKIDIDNQSLELLPVRIGCNNGICVCNGKCKTIIGYINRTCYEDYLKQKESNEQFFLDKIQNI